MFTGCNPTFAPALHHCLLACDGLLVWYDPTMAKKRLRWGHHPSRRGGAVEVGAHLLLLLLQARSYEKAQLHSHNKPPMLDAGRKNEIHTSS